MAPTTRSRSRTAHINALEKALVTAFANSVRKNAATTTTNIATMGPFTRSRSRAARANALRKALVTAFANSVRKTATTTTTTAVTTTATTAIIINTKTNTMRFQKATTPASASARSVVAAFVRSVNRDSKRRALAAQTAALVAQMARLAVTSPAALPVQPTRTGLVLRLGALLRLRRRRDSAVAMM